MYTLGYLDGELVDVGGGSVAVGTWGFGTPIPTNLCSFQSTMTDLTCRYKLSKLVYKTINVISINPDGKYAAIATSEEIVVVVDIPSGTPVQILRLRPLVQATCLVWAEERKLVVGDTSGQLCMVSLEENVSTWTSSHSSLTVVASDSRRISTGSEKGFRELSAR